MNSIIGALSFVYKFVYHFSVRSFIRDLIVGALPNFRMFSFDIFGSLKTFFM